MPQSDEFEHLIDTLKLCVAALREHDVPFMLGGSMAAWARGGPQPKKDLDLMVGRADADRALQVLAGAGMRVEHPPEEWLYKAWNGDVLIDVIFGPSGLEVTEEVLARADTIPVMSRGDAGDGDRGHARDDAVLDGRALPRLRRGAGDHPLAARADRLAGAAGAVRGLALREGVPHAGRGAGNRAGRGGSGAGGFRGAGPRARRRQPAARSAGGSGRAAAAGRAPGRASAATGRVRAPVASEWVAVAWGVRGTRCVRPTRARRQASGYRARR